jgi:hypothetical protein
MGMNLNFFDNIVFACLSDHERKYGFTDGLKRELDKNGIGDKSKVLHIDRQTSSQSETVAVVIEKISLDGFIMIKDSDSFFRLDIDSENNQVAYFDLQQTNRVNPGSKSYIQMDSNGILTNIVEKKVASALFSVGGYGFEKASEFYKNYKKISSENQEKEVYVSHIIFEMILSGCVFNGVKISEYKDWGTYDDWVNYVRDYKCMFVDIDGVLLKNTSDHFSNLGEGTVISENVDLLNKMHSEGKSTIILTTSRSESHRELTENELRNKGIKYDRLVMGLPHCQRILVNDFASSNPYPSCSAINIERDSPSLHKYM